MQSTGLLNRSYCSITCYVPEAKEHLVRYSRRVPFMYVLNDEDVSRLKYDWENEVLLGEHFATMIGMKYQEEIPEKNGF